MNVIKEDFLFFSMHSNINIDKIILDVFAEEDTYIDCGFGINIPKGTTMELTILKLYGNWQIRVTEKK